MLYNYFSTKNFSDLRQAQGYSVIKDNVYLGCFKQDKFFGYKFLIKVFKKLFPEIYVESDISLLSNEEINSLIKKYKPLHVRGFSFNKIALKGFSIKERGTFIIDLSLSVEDILNKLDYSLQKQIRKAENLGFFIKRAENIGQLKDYYDLLVNFRKKMGFRTQKFSNVSNQWRYLHSDKNSCYEIFLCYDNQNNLLSGLGVFINPESGSFIEVAAARSEKASNLPAGDFLRWGIIKWAKENSLRYYDLAGVNIDSNRSEKESNIYRYKEKWGGQFYSVYFYEKYRWQS